MKVCVLYLEVFGVSLEDVFGVFEVGRKVLVRLIVVSGFVFSFFIVMRD